MINNNMDMMQEMNNLADYDEYVDKCEEKDIYPRPLNNFCMGIGTLIYGLNKYGRGDWQGAYTKAFKDINEQEDKNCCGEKEEKPLPSILTQAKNFTGAVIEHMAHGMKEADNYEERISLCEDCPEFRKDERCAKCGCFMKVKAKWAEQKCPLNKW